MAAPATAHELVELLRKSRIVSDETLDQQTRGPVPEKAVDLASKLVKSGLITPFQAKLLLGGRWRGFRLGSYVIRDQIGQGGMGTVYLAEHETLKRRVAVKVLSPQEGTRRVAVERFLREARAAAALDHPNIVRIFDVAQQGDLHYLVMEYVEGQTLDEIVERQGVLPCGRAAEYVLQAAAGLEHAHEKGFVHRDIKPGNLILAKDGTLKILDMGLARSFEIDDKLTEVLDHGSVVGTADYISPEQAMNHPDLDIRADIYSLGATFYAIAAGRPPFEGNTTQKLLQHQLKEAPSILTLDRTFPPGLAAVLAKMLRKQPADRYQTPGDVMAALGPWLPNNARVVAALSRTNLAGSTDLQQTLNDVVTGSTGRLPRIESKKADDVGRKSSSSLPWMCLGLLAVGALAAGTAAALFQSDEVGQTIPTVPAVTQRSPAEVVDLPTANAVSSPPVKTETSKPPVKKTPNPVAVSLPNGPPVVYELDLGNAKSYRELVGTSLGLERKVIETSGIGMLPTGWMTSSGRVGDKVETVVGIIEGKPMIGLTGRDGARSGMLVTPRLRFTAAKLKLRFDTVIEGSTGAASVRFKPSTPAESESIVVGELPATEGRTKSVEWEWTPNGAAEGCFEIHSGTIEPNVTVAVLGFDVVELDAVVRKPIVQLDLRNLAPFVVTTTTAVEGGTRKLKTLSEVGTLKLPPSWYRWIEHPDATAEYFLETTNGKPALGIRNLSGKPGAYYTSPEATAPASGKLELRLLYQAGTPSLIRFRPSDKKPSFDAVKLPAVTDGWIAIVQNIDLKGHAGGFFEITTNGVGVDGAFRMREFQVFAKD